MVENRPLATVLSHVVMILGVLVIAFPVYVTFVASTHPLERIMQDSLRDRWYTAEQAVDYGFIDHVTERFDELFPLEPRTVAGLGVFA